MTAVEIERVAIGYRLPGRAATAATRRRLDAACRAALAGLDTALDDRGLDPEAQICVRHLRTQQRLRLGDADGPMTRALSAELAGELLAAIAAGGPNVVRYRSRRQALADVVLSAAAGETGRAWAWTQLGLWSRGTASDPAVVCGEALRVLGREPPAVVPILAAAAAGGRLGALLRHGRDGSWSELARAALWAAGQRAAPAPAMGALPRGAAGHSRDEARGDGREHSGDGGEEARAPAEGGSRRALAPHLDQSRIARAILGLSLPLSPTKARACAALCLLEIGPCAWLSVAATGSRAPAQPEPAPGSITAAWIAAVAEVLSAAATGARAAEAPPRHPEEPPTDRPQAANSGPAGDASRAGRAADRVAPRHVAGQPEGERTATSVEPDPGPPAAARRPEIAEVAAIATAAVSQHAGLLFLLHLVAELKLPSRLLGDARLAARSLRDVLAHVARALIPELPARDPALLAFVGLGPQADPPWDQGTPWTPEERDAAHQHAALLATALTRRLSLSLLPSIDGGDGDDRLVAWLVRRPAAVVADPGWIDVQFPIDSVSIEIRRAGLDLHPNWLPWLGVVIRFSYV